MTLEVRFAIGHVNLQAVHKTLTLSSITFMWLDFCQFWGDIIPLQQEKIPPSTLGLLLLSCTICLQHTFNDIVPNHGVLSSGSEPL